MAMREATVNKNDFAPSRKNEIGTSWIDPSDAIGNDNRWNGVIAALHLARFIFAFDGLHSTPPYIGRLRGLNPLHGGWL